MQLLETDIVIFGYGPITQEILASLQKENNSIICVTDNEYVDRDVNAHKNTRFLSRSEVVKTKVLSKGTLFSWRDKTPLHRNSSQMQEWLKSDLFRSERSLFLSSASVYADSGVSLTESLNNLELDVEENKKYVLEKIMSDIMQSKSIYHSNLRISNAYGKQLSYGFIGGLLKSITTHVPVQVYSGRLIVRDYISVTDIAFAVNKLLKVGSDKPNINISTGIGLSIPQVLNIFESHGHGFENRINVIPTLDVKSTSILDCTLLDSLVTWEPRNLEQGIAEILDFPLT